MAEKAVMISECLLDVDPFGKPAVLTNEEAIALLLTRIIMMEPGTNPLCPTMGVGLVSNFRYKFPADDAEIKRTISDQLATFLPDHQATKIEFIYNNNKTVDIKITVDNIDFIYDSAQLVPLTLSEVSEM